MGALNPETSKNHKKVGDACNKLVKRKIIGKFKGKTCADGRPQRCYIPKEDASSPKISLEALFSSLIIDAHERRDVEIFDVPGAYLNAVERGKHGFHKADNGEEVGVTVGRDLEEGDSREGP